MSYDDTRLDEAHAMPMAEVVDRLAIEGLRPAGSELVGPCPQCGGTDRFGINLRTGVFQCRKDCGPASKGDQVALVQHVLGMDFRAALEWLSGPAQDLTDAEKAARAQKAAAHRRKQDGIANKMRDEAIKSARAIWARSEAAEKTPVRDYLTRRSIPVPLLPALPGVLRYSRLMRYTVPDGAGKWETLFEGPCMVAAISDKSNRVTAVHRTWLDLAQPDGKRVIPDPRKPGEFLPAKKVLGSKKGGCIRLRTRRREGPDTIVMGEGIETTLSAMVAAEDPFDAAYWAGVDLGNMAGKQHKLPGQRNSGLPDLDDQDAFVPPAWARRLIYIQDGDSDPKATRAKLLAGLRRAMALRPGLKGYIVHAGDGADLNDRLRGKS